MYRLASGASCILEAVWCLPNTTPFQIDEHLEFVRTEGSISIHDTHPNLMIVDKTGARCPDSSAKSVGRLRRGSGRSPNLRLTACVAYMKLSFMKILTKKKLVANRSRVNWHEEACYNAPAVDKALDVLELLGDSSPGMSLTRIADALGRSKQELFRVLVCLQERGYLLRGKSKGSGPTLFGTRVALDDDLNGRVRLSRGGWAWAEVRAVRNYGPAGQGGRRVEECAA